MAVNLGSLWENIIGGIIVALIVPLYRWLNDRFCRIRLRRIFGADFRPRGEYHIVYSPLIIRREILQAAQSASVPKVEFPYSKFNQTSTASPFIFGVQSSVSTCELRAARHLTYLFTKYGKNDIVLSSDISVEEEMHKSWITLGGQGSNIKSRHTQEDPSNNLVKMLSASTFISAQAKDGLHCVVKKTEPADQEYDYGIILRIIPENFPDKVWVACMGFGEWGTSGSAWFLSNKWKELWRATISTRPRTWTKGANFAALIRVRKGCDQSARLVSKHYLFNSAEKVFLSCDSLCSLWYDPVNDMTLDEKYARSNSQHNHQRYQAPETPQTPISLVTSTTTTPVSGSDYNGQ